MSGDGTRSGSWLDSLKHWFDQEPKDRDDLLDEIKDAFNRQIIDVDAWRMLQGVLSLSGMRVRDVMVPRAQMVMLSAGDSLADTLKVILETQHSRYPVTGDDKESLVGLLMTKDLLIAYMRDQVGKLENLSSLYRPVFMYLRVSVPLNYYVSFKVDVCIWHWWLMSMAASRDW